MSKINKTKNNKEDNGIKLTTALALVTLGVVSSSFLYKFLSRNITKESSYIDFIASFVESGGSYQDIYLFTYKNFVNAIKSNNSKIISETVKAIHETEKNIRNNLKRPGMFSLLYRDEIVKKLSTKQRKISEIDNYNNPLITCVETLNVNLFNELIMTYGSEITTKYYGIGIDIMPVFHLIIYYLSLEKKPKTELIYMFDRLLDPKLNILFHEKYPNAQRNIFDVIYTIENSDYYIIKILEYFQLRYSYKIALREPSQITSGSIGIFTFQEVNDAVTDIKTTNEEKETVKKFIISLLDKKVFTLDHYKNAIINRFISHRDYNHHMKLIESQRNILIYKKTGNIISENKQLEREREKEKEREREKEREISLIKNLESSAMQDQHIKILRRSGYIIPADPLEASDLSRRSLYNREYQRRFTLFTYKEYMEYLKLKKKGHVYYFGMEEALQAARESLSSYTVSQEDIKINQIRNIKGYCYKKNYIHSFQQGSEKLDREKAEQDIANQEKELEKFKFTDQEFTIYIEFHNKDYCLNIIKDLLKIREGYKEYNNLFKKYEKDNNLFKKEEPTSSVTNDRIPAKAPITKGPEKINQKVTVGPKNNKRLSKRLIKAVNKRFSKRLIKVDSKRAIKALSKKNIKGIAVAPLSNQGRQYENNIFNNSSKEISNKPVSKTKTSPVNNIKNPPRKNFNPINRKRTDSISQENSRIITPEKSPSTEADFESMLDMLQRERERERENNLGEIDYDNYDKYNNSY